MARSLLTTPIIQPIFRAIALLAAKLSGWKMADPPPEFKKAIFAGGPHTSNWDFLIMLMGILIWRLDMHWIGKHTLFKGPAGPIMRWLGGISIDRTSSVNFVDQMVQRFNDSDELLLIIAPEGTRKPVERWRSGFYHMAKGADVPIVLIALDYQKKEISIAGIEKADGDAEQAIARYQTMLQHVTGKNPHNFHGYIPRDEK